MTQRPFDEIGAAFDSRWKHYDAARQEKELVLETDIAIVGTGAGGGTAARLLAEAGFDIVLIEEGPLRTSRDFRLEERSAFSELYQESAGRRTADKAIGILQGRAVGGSTLVNWTTSLHTPEPTMAHWRQTYGWSFASDEIMDPLFAAAELRHNVAPWAAAPNENNSVLKRGLEALGGHPKVVPRNVKQCWDLGLCGLGCPVNAKQSALLALLPTALEKGARLVSNARVERLIFSGDRIESIECSAIDAQGQTNRTRRVSVRARHVVLAAGAIGSPAVLLRSGAPDPHGRLGRRTFLHPVVVSGAAMPEAVNAFAGAPQTIYSDDYLWPSDGSAGFKLEAMPLYPVSTALTMSGFGEEHRRAMARFTHSQTLIALVRDGFHEDSPGGRVVLDSYGDPQLDYKITPYLFEGMRRAFLRMAEIQFAGGATEVATAHSDASPYRSWAEAKAGINALNMVPLRTRVVSAHVMGGCGLAPDPKLGVADLNGSHYQIENLTICDGSIFPTSVGANPQLTIYAFTARIAAELAERLKR